MSDWGGYKAIIDEARVLQKEELSKPPVACPLDGTPLEYREKDGLYNCPLGNYRVAGPKP